MFITHVPTARLLWSSDTEVTLSTVGLHCRFSRGVGEAAARRNIVQIHLHTPIERNVFLFLLNGFY